MFNELQLNLFVPKRDQQFILVTINDFIFVKIISGVIVVYT